MPRQIKKDSTNITDYMRLETTAGADATGVTITGLELQFVRNGSTPSAKADATALASSGSAHTDNAMIEIDATDQPGLYRVDYPDAASATGVPGFIFTIKGSGIRTAHKEIQLVDFDPEDSVRLGLTSLPNAAADAAGGLVISDTGGLDIDAVLSGNTPQGADNNVILSHTDYGLAKLVRSTTPANTLAIANGAAESDLTYIHGSALSETAGQLAAGFEKLFDVATPLLVASDVMRGTNSAATSAKQDTMETTLNDVPSTAEFEARSLLAAAYTIVADLGVVQSADNNIKLTTVLADTNELQTNQGNWLTAVGFSTHSAANVVTAMQADNTDLDYLVTDLINRKDIVILTGISEQFNDAGGSLGSIGSGYGDDGVTVSRPRQVIVKP